MDGKVGNISETQIIEGFGVLDHVIGTNPLLMSVAPIRIMVTGGAVSVLHFHVRQATEDVDFLLDPNIDAAHEYRTEFLQAVRTTEMTLDLFSGRFNDSMRNFIPKRTIENLFLETVEQNVVIYKGTNIVAFACKHEWALQSKLGALQSRGQDETERSRKKRKTDTMDAVELVRRVIEAKGDNQPLSREYLRGLTTSNIEWAIDQVAESFEETHGRKGIV